MAKEVKVLTKKSLAEEIAVQHELTKKAAAEIVNYVFDEAVKTLKKGGTVDINGFGKFTIKASKVPAFKASKTLKDSVK